METLMVDSMNLTSPLRPKKSSATKTPKLTTPNKSTVYSDRFIPSRLSSNLENAFNNIADIESSPVHIQQDITHENQGLLNNLIRSELLGKLCSYHPQTDYDSLTLANTLIANTSTPNVLRYSSSRARQSTGSTTLHTRESSLQPHYLNTSSAHPLASPQKHPRKIAKLPYKVLDAPSLADDYYLNLVDWSANNVVAVALGSCVFLWSACTSKVTKLCELEGADSITSITWAVRGSQIAVGSFSGTIQIYDANLGTKLRDMRNHSSRVGTLAWSSNMIASGSRDRTIMVQDVRVKSSQPATPVHSTSHSNRSSFNTSQFPALLTRNSFGSSDRATSGGSVINSTPPFTSNINHIIPQMRPSMSNNSINDSLLYPAINMNTDHELSSASLLSHTLSNSRNSSNSTSFYSAPHSPLRAERRTSLHSLELEESDSLYDEHVTNLLQTTAYPTAAVNNPMSSVNYNFNATTTTPIPRASLTPQRRSFSNNSGHSYGGARSSGETPDRGLMPHHSQSPLRHSNGSYGITGAGAGSTLSSLDRRMTSTSSLLYSPSRPHSLSGRHSMSSMDDPQALPSLLPVGSSERRRRSVLGVSTATANGFGSGDPCLVQELTGHKQEVCGLKWSFDERMLASGGNDNKLYVWQPQAGSRTESEPVCRFNDHTAAVKAVAWSPHQHGLLASGGGTADRHIRFWNASTSLPLHRIDTGSQVCNLVWSSTVNEIVSTHGYSLNQIIVWKYPSMQKQATLTGHTMRVLYLAMSPDGQSVVTGAGDESLRFWNLFPGPRSSLGVNPGQSILFPSSKDAR